MSWSRWTVLALIVLSAVMMTAALSCTSAPPAEEPEMTQAEKIERGRYLSMIGGCNDCHTPGTLFGAPDFERTLSGSELGWVGPWGVTYPRNLTPDEETGIGTWSEADIVVAVRTGARPDGSELLPPMPWPMYSTLTDEDAFALAAYLKSIPAIRHQVPDKLPPGTRPAGSFVTLPEPSAWDAPRTPPDSASAGH